MRAFRRFREGKTSFHEGADFLRKWGLIGTIIGLAAGVGAIALIQAIHLVNHLTLEPLAGYTPPLAAGEGGTGGAPSIARPWVIPLLTAGGGLVGGLLVWWLAPETAGIGTNAAIKSFHANEDIPLKTPLLKVLTSAITIGTGMTSGREGPIAQIGAGVGTAIARPFKLTSRERNIALAAGLGAGIAAMFKAPLAGAIIGAEIFYREDFEVEALVPAVIASVVGYALVGYVTGFQPIFSTGQDPAQFAHPVSLLLFALLGLACAVTARIGILFFFGTQKTFRRFPLPVATTLGGALTGVVALMVPSVIGTGYGWAQLALYQDYAALPVLMLLAAVAAEILCSSLTLGSGNSGGIFGPSVVTGCFLGAAFGYAAHALFPVVAGSAANYAIVGMVAYFAASAKAPISTVVMIAEMTGGYGLLAPALIAVTVAFLLSGHRSIFPAQVRTRLESPFHAEDFEPILLRRTRVRDAMSTALVTLGPDATAAEAFRILDEQEIGAIPVVDGGRLVGLVRRRTIFRLAPDVRALTRVGDVMVREPVTADPDEDLYRILERSSAKNVGHFPVVEAKGGALVGILSRSDVARVIERHRQHLKAAPDAAAPLDAA